MAVPDKSHSTASLVFILAVVLGPLACIVAVAVVARLVYHRRVKRRLKYKLLQAVAEGKTIVCRLLTSVVCGIATKASLQTL